MLLRSQNGKRLINLDNIVSIDICKLSCGASVNVTTVDDVFTIARYDNEAIAMFVMKIFEKMYIAHGSDIYIFGFPINHVAKELTNDDEVARQVFG